MKIKARMIAAIFIRLAFRGVCSDQASPAKISHRAVKKVAPDIVWKLGLPKSVVHVLPLIF